MRNLETELQRPAATLEEEVTELFRLYRAPLLRYLLTLGVTAGEGEEIVQEVFLSLFQHLRQGKSREHLRGWIFRVGHNLGLKARQRAARRPSLDLDEQHPCPEQNPEQQAEQGERQRRLLAMVAALPARDRQCLHLRAEGLRYREIAEVLNLSLGSVALILSRAVLKLTQAERVS